MANYYTHITQAGDTLTSIEDNGGTYNVGVSQDIDCRKVTATGEVKCTSTTAPFYPPVVTTAQRNAMTVTVGAMVYNSTTSKLNYYDGAWKVVEVAS